MRTCSVCETKAVVETSLEGCFLPWQNYNRVKVRKPVQGFKCSNCGTVSFSSKQVDAIDQALEESVKMEAKQGANFVLKSTDKTQTQLAMVLGITPEYFSNVKNGNKLPGPVLFNLLRIIRKCPQVLQELGIHNSYSSYAKTTIEISKVILHAQEDVIPKSRIGGFSQISIGYSRKNLTSGVRHKPTHYTLLGLR